MSGKVKSESFKLIDKELESRGLNMPHLNVLHPDELRYRAILYQPLGDIECSSAANDKYIRSKNPELVHNKFKAFLSIATEKNADFVASPEFSCPWSNITKCLDENILPSANSLWVLGCESILPSDLSGLLAKYQHQGVVTIIEEELLRSDGDKVLDPICIIFNTTEKDSGNTVIVLLIQAKMHPMGGSAYETEFDTDNLILGKYRYVVRNDENSIHFATFICADTLVDNNLSKGGLLPGFLHSPYILLHLQLNRSTKTRNFRDYRTTLFSNSLSDLNKELICLNWANNTNLVNRSLSSGGTSLYIKTNDLVLEDQRFKDNDHLGMFYNNWSTARSAIYQFVPTEGVFLFENYKCSKALGSPQTSKRTGPKMLVHYTWSSTNWTEGKWIAAEFEPCVKGLLTTDFDEPTFKSFFDDTLTYLDIERLLLITSGDIEPQLDWHQPKSLRSLRIDDNELSRRLTFLYDSDASVLTPKRSAYLRFLKVVKTLLTNDAFFPTDARFDNFRQGARIDFHTKNQNVSSPNGTRGLVVYIGEETEAIAKEIFDNLIKISDSETQNQKMIVLAYSSTLHGFQTIYDKRQPQVDDNTSLSPTSILKGRS